MNAVSIHKRNWFFAASCVALVSVNTPPAGAQVECCARTAGPTLALQPQEQEYLGISVAVDGATAFAGAKDYDGPGDPPLSASGRVLVFDFDSFSGWGQVDDLRANDEFTGDQFGFSVALDGDFAVIGAPGNDDNGNSSGSAYIFERDGANWNEVVELHAPDAEPNELFGSSVAINGDLAVIGAIQGDKDPFEETGAVYIFDRNEPTPDAWGFVQKLTASDAASGDTFGHSVSIDGDLIVVGAPLAGPPLTAGAAYIFRFNDPDWDEEAILALAEPVDGDIFGTSVSVAGDLAVIGAPFRDIDAEFDNKGAAYVYRFEDPNWVQKLILSACVALDNDQFGGSVSIDEKPANGSFVVVVGAIQTEGAGGNGRAEVFGYRGAGWAPLHQLTASDGGAFDNFGTAVSIKGGTAVVGALGWDVTDDEGAIYGFDGLDTAPSCVCTGDLDDDGDVGLSDLLALLAAWGPCPAPPAGCPADFDGDDDVGVNDLLALLANWSDCIKDPIALEDAQDCIDKFYPDDMEALIACIEAFGG